MNNPSQAGGLMSVGYVAMVLDISKRSVWRMLEHGQLTRVRIGPRLIRVACAEVQEYIRQRTDPEPPK